MAEDDRRTSDSKTEEPTEKRLGRRAKKGDVPSSREAGTSMTVFSLFLFAVFLLPLARRRPDRGACRACWCRRARSRSAPGTRGWRDVGRCPGGMLGEIGRVLAPSLRADDRLAALFGVLIQGETVVAAERHHAEMVQDLARLRG